MFAYVSRIKDGLHHQLNHKQLLPRNANQLLSLLKHLPPIEKDYLRLHFRAIVWSPGSPNVIFLMQCAHILSMTEYICHQHSSADNESDSQQTDLHPAQLIFDDLLECDPRLLANLIQCMGNDTEHGIRVTEILTEGIARMFIDLLKQPNVVPNYLRRVSSHISRTQFDAFRWFHIKFLMGYHHSTVNEALGLQSKWNTQFNENSKDPSMLNQLVMELCHDRTASTLLKLLDMSREPDFSGWQWFLHLIRMIVRDCGEKHVAIVQKFLRDSFKTFLKLRSDHVLYASLLTARQVCKYNEQRFGSYFKWYKGTFSEMRYTQTVEEFKASIQTLIRSIKYELDIGMLEVHVQISISAPPKCNDLVYSFKQISRSRIMELQDQQLNATIDDGPMHDIIVDEDSIL